MTSIDDLFRGRAVPTANPNSSNPNKRKLDPSSSDPSELHKATRINGKSPRAPSATVTDEEDDELEAGPSLPPADGEADGQEEEEDPDDEEGRFFGGGVGADTRDALDYLDDGDEVPSAPEKLDAAWLRRTVQSFSTRIAKNAEQRAKFEDQPQHFMASEAALDQEIKGLSLLSEAPSLYGLFAELGGVEKLTGLLAHENTDVAIGAVQVLAELTDEDVTTEQEQWDEFVAAALEADLPGLLVGNLKRLDEDGDDAEGDRSGVYHSLNLVENLASQVTAAEAMLQESGFLTWLIQRMQKAEPAPSPPVTQNKQYAAEVLAILLQASAKNRQHTLTSPSTITKTNADGGVLDVVDILLQLLAPYRKRDPPKDTNEEEYAENVFDSLTILVDTNRGKSAFVRNEGVELVLIMLREATSVAKPKFSKPRALRLLDHAAAAAAAAEVDDGGEAALDVCEKIVDAAGLKPLFAAFMKGSRDDAATGHASDRAEKRQDTEHILGMFASMLRLLPGESAARIRLLSKFLEGKDYEKLARLVRLRREYKLRLSPVDERIAVERQAFLDAGDGSAAERAELEDEWLSRRLDAGLFSFQTVDVLLAWLVAEDDAARTKIGALLGDDRTALGDVASTLREQLAGLEADKGGADADGLRGLESSIDMLRTLIGCIE